MITVLKVFHVIISIGVIVGVLLQSGKSAGLSGAIDGGASSILGGGDSQQLDQKLNKITYTINHHGPLLFGHDSFNI
jgi:preprotein translocase subunit SecG